MRKILLHDDKFLTLLAKEAEDILSFLKQLSRNFSPLQKVKKLGSEKDGSRAKPIAPYVGSKLNPSAKEWNVRILPFSGNTPPLIVA
jgi:hypothetical protein